MAIRLGDAAPDFVVETTRGSITFREWKRGHWAVLLSHPRDFTPVCTTELVAVARLMPEFHERDTKVLVLSVDPLESHYRWHEEIERLSGVPVTFPMAADPNRWVAKLYGMIHPGAEGWDTVRSLFLIDPRDRVRLMLVYPPSTGRSFEEVLRVLDSLRLADEHGVATPAGWRKGDDVLIPIEISSEEARTRFPKGFEVRRPYLRFTPDPES